VQPRLRGHPALCDNIQCEGAAEQARRAEDESMGDLLQPWHIVVLGVVAFLLFGAKRLPELGKGLGEGLKGFKEGIRGVSEPLPPVPPVQPTVQQTAAPVPPPPAPVEPPK
jgi:sec-independent protein translocase protein TatA